jgi:hypothetical protein
MHRVVEWEVEHPNVSEARLLTFGVLVELQLGGGIDVSATL